MSSSIVDFAETKNAVEFKKALHEKIQERVDAALAEAKKELAGKLLGENNGDDENNGEGEFIVHHRTKNKIAKQTQTYKHARWHAEKLNANAAPGQHEWEVHSREYYQDHILPKYTKHPAMKEETMRRIKGIGKATDRLTKEGLEVWSFPTDATKLSEKVITPGSVEHMAHAVHACHSGHCDALSHRGSFTQYNHPDYAISKDHGGISTEPSKIHYYVQGAGGMHKFSAEHTKAGVDISHHGMVG